MHRYARISHQQELGCRLNLKFCWFLHSLSTLPWFVRFLVIICRSKELNYRLMLHQSFLLGSCQNAFQPSLYVQYLKLKKLDLLIHLSRHHAISPFVKAIHAYFSHPHQKPLGRLQQRSIPLNLFRINHRLPLTSSSLCNYHPQRFSRRFSSLQK